MVNNEIFQFPSMPRLILDTLTILPKIDRHNKPVPGRWVLPGRQEITTTQARKLANARRLQFHILQGDNTHE